MRSSTSFYPRNLKISNKKLIPTSSNFSQKTHLNFHKNCSVKNSRKNSHQKKLISQCLNEIPVKRIFQTTLNSPTHFNNGTLLTESQFFFSNDTKKKCKQITYGKMIKNLKYRTKSDFSKNLIPNKENKKIIPNKIQVTRKFNKIKRSSRNSSTTISTNTSDKLKINNNILSPKFLDAQNKWRNNFGATIIQKVFRGFYYRKYNFKKKIIYQRKKIKINKGFLYRRNKFNCNLRINRININNNNNNYYKCYQTFSNDFKENGIKTIIIESFNKTKYYTNNNSRRNTINTKEIK